MYIINNLIVTTKKAIIYLNNGKVWFKFAKNCMIFNISIKLFLMKIQ